MSAAEKVARYLALAERHYTNALEAIGSDPDGQQVLDETALGDLAARIATAYIVVGGSGTPQGGQGSRLTARQAATLTGDLDPLDALLAEGHGSVGYKAPFTCDRCYAVFATREESLAHKAKAHAPKSVCGYCRAEYDDEETLRAHTARVHGQGWRQAKLAVGDLVFILFDKETKQEVHRESIDRMYLDKPTSVLRGRQMQGRSAIEGWAAQHGYRIVEEATLSPLRTR